VHLGHPSEADVHADPRLDNTCARDWICAELLTALPHAGYQLSRYKIIPAPLTGHLDEGDVVDTGDRVFRVFHLPGHSPGSIALYEPATETLFSGDVIYDGALIDNALHSDPERYTLNRSNAYVISRSPKCMRAMRLPSRAIGCSSSLMPICQANCASAM
jgi:glyoxylase-like metal-dependent hydrolase (beta-lactamase superfamily II)